MQVTVVDNDKALLRSLAIVLSREGHRVTCFDDAQAAAATIGEEGAPDVLIVDYVMPGLDGVDLLERVKPRLPACCTLILISGHTDRLPVDRLARLGLSRVLSKPLDLQDLRDLVRGAPEGGENRNEAS